MDIRNFFKKKGAGVSKKTTKKRVAPEEAADDKKDSKAGATAKATSATDYFSQHSKPTSAQPKTKKKEGSPPKKQRITPPPKLSIRSSDDDDDDEDHAITWIPSDDEKPVKKSPPKAKPVSKTPSKAPQKNKPPPPQTERSPVSPKPKISSTKRKPPPRKPAPVVIHQPTRTRSTPPNTDDLQSLCLAGLTFCCTGIHETVSRDDATELVKELGGRVTTMVSSKTNYLIVLGNVLEDGRSADQSKKYQRAQQESSVIIIPDVEHFFGLVEQYGGASTRKVDTTKVAVVSAPAKAMNNPYAAVTKNPYASASKKSANPYAQQPKNPYANAAAKSPQSLKTPGKRSSVNELWVDRHKPLSSREILGNGDAVRKLTAWLGSWERIWNTAASNKTKSSPNGPFRAALLSGPPGIGKTTTATVVAAESGRDVLEFNASDVRSKKALQEQVGDITGSQTIQFGGSSRSRQQRCIIMDEVDGMGAGDRSGMSELIQMIKKSRVPIICICNDRQSQKMKSLLPYCLDLRYRRPTKTVIANRAIQIAQKEGLSVEHNAVEAIADSCGNDMRQVLNCLQMWAAKNTTLSYKNVKERDRSTNKDEILRVSLFDATRTIVEGRKGLAQADANTERSHFFHRNDAYFVDYNFVGLMVHQNYLKIIQQQFNEAKRSGDDDKVVGVLDRTYSAAACMSDWAVAESNLRGEQNWSLLPFTASLTVQTGSFAGGHNGGILPGFPEFSTWLGRNSTRGKKVRLLSELGHHLNASVSGGRSELRLSYLPVFRDRFVRMLQQGNMEETVQMMDNYGLSRDDILEKLDEFRLDKSSESSFEKLDSKCKAALTRTYNQGSHTSQALVAEEQSGKPKRKINAASAAMEMKDPDAIDDDAVEEQPEEIDDDLDAEAIKALFKKKGRKKKAATTKKAPAKKAPAKKRTKKK